MEINRFVTKITRALEKFSLNLDGKNILTEAASGNYVVTSVLSALAGAEVTAIACDSNYATIDEIKNQTFALANKFNVAGKIKIISCKNDIDFSKFDIVTNTGFIRPINKLMISKLSAGCVIPLMWEPWEYRSSELDLPACRSRGVKVYGTDESDIRLKTMEYIGFIALHFLLESKMSPFSSKILLLGNKRFCLSIEDLLIKVGYQVNYICEYSKSVSDIQEYSAIILAENENNELLIGSNGFISSNSINDNQLIIHISGNIECDDIKAKLIPSKPAKFSYMSFTTDFIDSQAVIDLHTAGLKVAEGMLLANNIGLIGEEYRDFMESKYPALAFDDKRYW